jgi:hypothetical protein
MTTTAFPIGNRPDAGMMNDLKKQDFNRLKKEVAKDTRNAGNNLAIKEDGKIKDGAIRAIEGAPDQEAEAKQIIKNESEMVKEIKKVEDEKHPRQWEVKRAMADVKNLSVVHPELADKVVEK